MNITATEAINAVSYQHTTNITRINIRSLQAPNELHGTSLHHIHNKPVTGIDSTRTKVRINKVDKKTKFTNNSSWHLHN